LIVFLTYFEHRYYTASGLRKSFCIRRVKMDKNLKGGDYEKVFGVVLYGGDNFYGRL
jgi:hypothetical protein